MDGRPIGMFDSGFGGLTVARALIDLAPHEDLVYVGDTGRYPYGPRDLDEVRSFAVQIARWLIDEIDVKLIVVACNTASAAGARHPARRCCRSRSSGSSTPGCGRWPRPRATGGWAWSARWGPSARAPTSAPSGRCPSPLELVPASCPGFVEFVERGETRSDQVVGAGRAPAGAGARRRGRRPAARVHPLPVPGPDHRRCHGPRRRARVLGRRDGLRGARHPGRPGAGPGGSGDAGTLRVFSSGDVAWFRTVGSRLFGAELGEVGRLTWPDPPAVAEAAPGGRRAAGAASG